MKAYTEASSCFFCFMNFCCREKLEFEGHSDYKEVVVKIFIFPAILKI